MNRKSGGNDLKNRKSKQASSNSTDKLPRNRKDQPSSNTRSKKEDKQTNEKKRVSFSSTEPTEGEPSNIEKNLEPKRKLRDVGKLIISPPEPVGYLVVYSNAKKTVRPDVMTLWKLDPNSDDHKVAEENYLSEIRFGTDEKSNNVQIKRAINKCWPILENHCILTYMDNSTVLLLEEGAMVLVNGVVYKNCDTTESDIINTNRVNISNGDIIDLDGRLLIYSKYNNPSYIQGYQEKFDEYIRELNKRKRDKDEDDDQSKRTRLEDENDDKDVEGLEEDDLSDEDMIDSEEINNTLSEYNDSEESEHSGNHHDELGGIDSELTEKVPSFYSQPPQTPQLQNLKTSANLLSQEESQIDEEHIEIDPEFLEEIIQKVNAEASSKIEELEIKLNTQEKKETESRETIQHLQAELEKEVTKSKKLEGRVQHLEKQLADKNEEIEEYKRSLEKTVQRAEKGETLKKEYDKQKFKISDMEGKLEEKCRLLEVTLEENRILKLSSENMRSQLSLLRKNSLLFESLKDLVQKNEKQSFWENFEAITKIVSETMKKSQPMRTLVDNDQTLILSADDIESSQISSPNHNKKVTAKKPLLLTKQSLYQNTTTNKKSNTFIKPSKSTIDTQELLDNMDDDYSAILDAEYQDYENLSE